MCVVQRGLKVSNHTGKLCVSWGLAVGSMGTVGMENSVYCHFFFFGIAIAQVSPRICCGLGLFSVLFVCIVCSFHRT